LFATGDNTAVVANTDLYFNGDMVLGKNLPILFRFATMCEFLRKSQVRQKPDVEAIVSSGRFIQSFADKMPPWTTQVDQMTFGQWYDDETSTTRYQACETLIDHDLLPRDPRLKRMVCSCSGTMGCRDAGFLSASDQMRIDGVDTC
jgi:hypothetical protein